MKKWNRTLLLGLSSLVYVFGCKTTGSGPAKSELRTIGGNDTHAMPAVGALMINGSAFCTGTLIAPDTVVTAAHCIKNVQAEDINFVMEDENGKRNDPLKIKALIMHPQYDHAANNYDIALLKLVEKAPFRPMPVLKKIDEKSIKGSSLLAVGYGRKISPADATGYDVGIGIKRSAQLTVKSFNVSKLRLEDSGKSTCHGDSGGAYVQLSKTGEAALAGVTSCGDPSCKSYNVATRIDAFLRFLEINTSQADVQIKPVCAVTPSNGFCENNTANICRNDCYEASLFQERCLGDNLCRINPFSGLAQCYNPARLQKLTLTFREMQLADGKFTEGAALEELYLFIDYPDQKWPRPEISSETPRTDQLGSISLELSTGQHHLLALKIGGSNDVTLIPKTIFNVDKGVTQKVITIPTKKLQITVPTDIGLGNAVYITGQGPLLGDWQKAQKLRYDGLKKAWIYDGVMVKDLEFKLFKSAWVEGDELDMKSQKISWENTPGNHKVGEGGRPYFGAFQHVIKAEFR